MAGLLMLLAFGVLPETLLFAVPLGACVWGARACLAASRRLPERRLAWGLLAAMLGIAAPASALGMVSELAAGSATAGLYVGLVASVAMVVAAGVQAAAALRARGWAAMVDQLLPAVVVASLFVFGLVLPGLDRGDVVLTGVLVIDLVALVLFVAGAAGAAPAAKGTLIAAVTLVCIADGAAAGDTASIHLAPVAVTPLLRGLAAAAFGWAATRDVPSRQVVAKPSDRGVYAQALLPLVAIVGYPVIVGIVAAGRGDLGRSRRVLRPALPALDRHRVRPPGSPARRAAPRRRARAGAGRRRPAPDARARGADAPDLHDDRGARGAARHGPRPRGAAARGAHVVLRRAPARRRRVLVLSASGGDGDAPVPSEVPGEPLLDRRAGRYVAALPLVARGRTLGVLSLARPECEGPFTPESSVLGLLTDQLAVALQNTRDHQEKLEAAIRDPLTGLYNRRFFYEAFSQEIARHDRYGGNAALVLFDIDDFRTINDSLGPQIGDEVLQEIGRIRRPARAPQRHVRPHRRRGVRPADAPDRPARRAAGRRAPAHGGLAPQDPPDRARHPQRRRRGAAPGRLDARGPPAPRRPGPVLGASATARTCARWPARRSPTTPRSSRRECSPTCTAWSPASTPSISTPATTPRTSPRTPSPSARSWASDDDRIVRRAPAAFLHDIGKVAVSTHDPRQARRASPTRSSRRSRSTPRSARRSCTTPGCTTRRRWVGAASRAPRRRAATRTACASSEIPLEARIIFVADSFEAMTSDRPYRRGHADRRRDRRAAPLRRHPVRPARRRRRCRAWSSAAAWPCSRCAIRSSRQAAALRPLPCGFQQPSMKRAISLVRRSGAVRSSRIELGLEQAAVGQLVDEHARSR